MGVNNVKKLIHRFKTDSLFQNSVYLMMATASMSGFGFLFWLLNSKLLTTSQIGIGTTLISSATLISGLSQFGLGSSLIKYLPTSDKKHEKINTSLTLVLVSSFIISLLFLVLLPKLSPELLFLEDNFGATIIFILLTVFTSLNIVSDNIFIAYRKTVFVFIKNTVFSLVKLFLPFVLVSFGAYGIYISYGLGSTIAFLLALYFLFFQSRFKFKMGINTEIVKRMTKFSLGNHIATFVGSLPTLVLPLLITSLLGSKYSAYYYMDIMIANLLFVIPTASAQSLFAEGSYNGNDLGRLIGRAIRQVFYLIVPAILVTVFFGKYLLLAFGRQYATGGFQLLQVISISGLFVSVSLICESILKIKHQIKELIVINIIYAVLSLLASYFLAIKFGLVGIGFGLLVANILTTGSYLIVVKKAL